MLPVLLDVLRVARCGPGRPRTSPDALLADRAYSSRAHRALLQEQGITAVIPGPVSLIWPHRDGLTWPHFRHAGDLL